MNSQEIIKEKLEFLKLEYQQLKTHNDNLEELEWKVRQLSITLWLASMGVGLGLQGVTANNIYFLIASTLIPYGFLYLDARVYRWISIHEGRMKQIELFVSGQEYTLPNTGKKTSFAEFCSNLEKTYDFPVLDFHGEMTCGADEEFIFRTTATSPHMVRGVRRYFYQFQIFGALLILSIQLYTVYQTAWAFSVSVVGLVAYMLLVGYARHKERTLRSSIRRRLLESKITTQA